MYPIRDWLKSMLQMEIVFVILGTTVTMCRWLSPQYFKPVLLVCCTLSNLVLMFHMWWEHTEHGEEDRTMGTVSSLMACMCLMAIFYVVVLLQDSHVERVMSVEEYERQFEQLPISAK